MNLLSFFQIRVGALEARQPEFEKRKVWVWGGFTQGGGLGGLAWAGMLLPFQGAGGHVSAGAHRTILGRGELSTCSQLRNDVFVAY